MKSISEYDVIQNEIDIVLTIIKKYRSYIDNQNNKKPNVNFQMNIY